MNNKLPEYLIGSLNYHFRIMEKLFSEFGFEPFDLDKWAWTHWEELDEELDEGIYNFLPYFQQVEITTGKKKKISMKKLATFLNVVGKDPDEMSEREYDLYQEFSGEKFEAKNDGIYMQTTVTRYQFTAQPTVFATFQPWQD